MARVVTQAALFLGISTLLGLSPLVSAAGAKCGNGTQCPQSSPCCGEYGECGIGAFCLGGCDPLNSYSLDACMPAPACSSQDYKLDSLDGLVSITEYLGDASKASFVYSGEPKSYSDGNGNQMLLTMPKDSVGTLLATTAYVWYGKISATLKTSRDQGVVTAFILMSDVKDEVDFEFVGVDLQDAQSNYYWQGVKDYTHGDNLTVSGSNTFDDYHTYEIDWKEDSITWSVDGKSMRTLEKSSTWNAAKGRYEFPQTPSRVELSLWPAGLESNGQGTVEWAGGLINWDSPDIQNAHYYYAVVKDVSVECYDPPDGVNKTGSKAYVYTDDKGLNTSVAIVDADTALKSFQGTGLNPDAGGSSPSGTSSADGAAATTDAPSIPGLSGVGVGADGQRGGGGAAPSQVGGAAGTQTAPLPGQSDFHGFSQGGNGGNGGGGSSGSAAGLQGDRTLRGSMLAVLLAIGALLAW